MSEFYDALNDYLSQPGRSDPLFSSGAEKLNRQIEQRSGEVQKAKQEQVDTLGVPVNDEAYLMLKKDFGNDPAGMARMLAAMKIANQYRLPVQYTREHLDEFVRALGVEDGEPDRNWLNQIGASIKIGQLTPRRGKIGNEARNFYKSDPEYFKSLVEEAGRIDGEVARLKDRNPNKAMEILEASTESLEYSLKSRLYGLPGQVLGGVIGQGDTLGTLFSYGYTSEVETGNEFLDLLEAFGDPDIAYDVSGITGPLSALIEAYMDNALAGLGKAGGALLGLSVKRTLAESIANMVFSNVKKNGGLFNASKRILQWLAGGGMEAGEEGLQQLSSSIGYNAAAAMKIDKIRNTPEFQKLSPEEQEEYGKALEELYSKKGFNEISAEVAKAAKGGFYGYFLTGLFDVGMSSIGDAGAAHRIKTAAEQSRSLEEFKNLTKDAWQGMTDENREQAQNAAYERGQRRRDREEERLAAEIKAQGGQLAGLEAREVNEAGEDVSPGVYRRSGGSLYTRIEDEKRDG
ncbi:MAG: hypothetical protein LBL19_08510, partial [Spirochaetaceae bacterium]|nr:hypothetical protein [Spirochaetaceae bacterium]